jgi:hypothetical protein
VHAPSPSTTTPFLLTCSAMYKVLERQKLAAEEGNERDHSLSDCPAWHGMLHEQ